MSRLLGLLRPVGAALLLLAPALAPATTITLLHVNDTHAHLGATGPKDAHLDGTLGGLPKAAAVIAGLRASTPNTLLLHAGDLFQGDVYFYAGLGSGGTPLLALPELQLLAGLGLDAVTVGNHELVLGTETLASFLAGAMAYLQGSGLAPPAVLSANLDLAAAGLTGVVQPGVVKGVGGVRVGLFGLTVLDYLSRNAPFLGVTDEQLAALAAAEVADLRSQGATVVVCLSHAGIASDQYLAAHVAGLDAIVGGHDHVTTPEPILVAGPGGKSVPVVQAGAFYRWVGALTLSVEGDQVAFQSFQLVPVDAAVAPLDPVAAAVQGLQAQIDALLGQDFWHRPLAFALADVAQDPPDGWPQRDSPIGDLVTDALRAWTGTDVALTVNGFSTEGLARGVVVRDDAFRIVSDGFDPTRPWTSPEALGFPLYRISMDGRNLRAALATALAQGGDFFVQVSGMRYVYDSRTTPPALLGVWVHGRPVEPGRVYTLTVNLGLLSGLADFPVQLAGPPAPVGVDEYTAVSAWIGRLKVLLYFPQGRILDVARRWAVRRGPAPGTVRR